MRKGNYTYVIAAIFIAFSLCLSSISLGYCQDSSKKCDTCDPCENKCAKFFKNVFKWPFNVTKKTAEGAACTTEKAVTTVAKTGTAAVETVACADPCRAQDIVVEPVTGSVDTAYTAVTETAKAPLCATEEAVDDMNK